ncbi:MAG: beta-aspartyl-peptidase, partial [bacterium]|nr:beta-aspartyl-peptidase [bacterium]
MLKTTRTLLPLVLLLTLSVSSWGAETAPPEKEPARIEFALAIHGGAGVIPKTMPEERKEQYVATLRKALTRGRELLDDGASSIDVVEQVIHILEDSPLFNAGKGAVFTHVGTHELDAAIMD